MKHQVKTINLAPSDEQYKYLLQFIIDKSTNFSDVRWAKNELKMMIEDVKRCIDCDFIIGDLGTTDPLNEVCSLCVEEGAK